MQEASDRMVGESVPVAEAATLAAVISVSMLKRVLAKSLAGRCHSPSSAVTPGTAIPTFGG